jgi:hypothetical protein
VVAIELGWIIHLETINGGNLLKAFIRQANSYGGEEYYDGN